MLYTGCENIVHDAFNMAYGRKLHLAQQPYYHSDGGAQFTSKETTELIEAAGFMKSVSRPQDTAGQSADRELLEDDKAGNAFNTAYEI